MSVSRALDDHWAPRLAVGFMSYLFITQRSTHCLPTICMCLLTVKLMKLWQTNFHSLQLSETHIHTLCLSPLNYINETSHLPANRFGLACFTLMGIHTSVHTQTHAYCSGQGYKRNFRVHCKELQITRPFLEKQTEGERERHCDDYFIDRVVWLVSEEAHCIFYEKSYENYCIFFKHV